MEHIPEIAYWIVIIHLVADFFLQSGSWAARKYNSMEALTNHVLMYTIVWAIFWCTYQRGNIDIAGVIVFCTITCVLHLVVDYVSSKIMHYYWEKKRFGSNVINWGFFTVLGIDQAIHIVSLFYTYYFSFG